MCVGFFGIQIGFGLQNANVSRIFQTLGAEVDSLAILWIAAPLNFLEAGRRYRAEIYRDAPDAHWRTNREAIVIETREVAASDVLELRLAPGGGQAVRFVPL